MLSGICMSPTITPTVGPHLRADQDLVLIGMFLLGCGVLLVDGVLHVHVAPGALRTMLLLCPMVVSNQEDWSATEFGEGFGTTAPGPGPTGRNGQTSHGVGAPVLCPGRYAPQAVARLL